MRKLIGLWTGSILVLAFLLIAATSFAVTKDQLYAWDDARKAGQQLTDEQIRLLTDAGFIVAEPEGGELDDFGGPDSAGYYYIDSDEQDGPAFDWLDISNTGTQIYNLGDDDCQGPFDIGFDFPFYGEVKDQFYCGSNGTVGFNSSNLEMYSHYTIPYINTPNDDIQFWQTDMNCGYGFTSVYYQTTGEEGDRICVIAYYGISQYGNYEASGTLSCEIFLHESGEIVVQYNDIGQSVSNQGSMSIGIENSSGTIGLQYCYNDTGSAPDNGTAILYYYPSGNLEVYVEDDYNADPVIGAQVELYMQVVEGDSVFIVDRYTDEQGNVGFYGLPPGNFDVYVYHDDYLDGDTTGIQVSQDQITNLTLPVTWRYSDLSGVVQDVNLTGLDATVTIEELDWSVNTNPNTGEYYFGNVPAGDYSVRAFSWGYVPETAQVNIPGGHTDETQDYELDELSMGDLVVTFEDQNQDPIPDAPISLHVSEYEGYDQEGVTDANGQVTFEDVPETNEIYWELAGTAYFFVEAFGDSVMVTADITNNYTFEVVVPERPTNVEASNDAADITLNWSPVSLDLDETFLYYEVYPLGWDGFPEENPVATTPDTFVVLEDLPFYQEYGFTVAALYEEYPDQYLGGGSDPAYGVALGFPGYSWEEIEFDWIEVSNDPEAYSWQPEGEWDEMYLDLVQMGFDFPFYGEYLEALHLGSTGFMYVDGETWGQVEYPLDLYNPYDFFGVIAPFANPMVFERNNSGVYCTILGDSVMVLEWWLPYVVNDGLDHAISFEAKLYSDGTIEFHYQDLDVGGGPMGELIIGIADEDAEDVYRIFPDDINWMPTDESAVRLTVEEAVYAELELTVTDDTDDANPVPGFDVCLSTGQVARTDAGGVANFSYIPIHRDNTVNIFHQHPFYSTLDENVTLNEGTNTAAVTVSPNTNPPQSVQYDGYSEDAIHLWWDSPEPGYNVNEPDTWALHTNNQYSYYYTGTYNLGEGVNYDGIELNGPYDINGVEFYLYNCYSYEREARMDIWDISDPDNPEALFTHFWNPSLGYYESGWEYVEVGLTDLWHTNIIITITTPDRNYSERYLLYYDGEWNNCYGAGVLAYNVGEEYVSFSDWDNYGNPLINTYVTRHGEYTQFPGGDDGQGGGMLGGNNTGSGSARMTLEQMIDAELAVQDDFGRWRPKHDMRHGTSMWTMGPREERRWHPTPRMPEPSGDELDDYQDEILYYNVYRDDILVHSTSSPNDMDYTDEDVTEGTEYDYCIAAVYDIDGEGTEAEGPWSDPTIAAAIMPPSPPGYVSFTTDDNNITATLEWNIPTTDENGDDLDDLDGFHVYRNFELVATVEENIDSYTDNLDHSGSYGYFVTAFDNTGNESEPEDFGWELIGDPDYSYDFETNGDPFTAVNFEWGDPTSGPEEGNNASTYCWATVLDGQYEDATLYTLTLPSYYVENEEGAVTFASWWDFETYYDGWCIFGSTDEGQSWFQMDWDPENDMSIYSHDFWGGEYDNPLAELGLQWGDMFKSEYSNEGQGEAEWMLMGVRLADYVGQNITVMIAAGTDEANHLHDGLYIDDLELWNVSETSYGDIDGTVTASGTGEAIEGAVVTIVGLGQSAETDEFGDYSFIDVPVQDWTSTVSMHGYNDAEAVVAVPANQTVTQNFALLKPECGVPEIVSLNLPTGYTGEYDLPVDNFGDGTLFVSSLVVEGLPDGEMFTMPGEDNNREAVKLAGKHGKASIVESHPISMPRNPDAVGPVAGGKTAGNNGELDETVDEWMFSTDQYECMVTGLAWDNGVLLISSSWSGYLFAFNPENGSLIDYYNLGYWGMPLDIEFIDGELWALHLYFEGEMEQTENGFIGEEDLIYGDFWVNVVNWYDYEQEWYSDVIESYDYNWDGEMLWGLAIPPDFHAMYMGTYPVPSADRQDGLIDQIHVTGEMFGDNADLDVQDAWQLDGVTGLTWWEGSLWAATFNRDAEYDEMGQLYEFDEEGNVLGIYDFPSSPGGAIGLTFDDEGFLWYAETTFTNIYRLELDDEPGYFYSITENLELEGNIEDVMTFGIEIPDWAEAGSVFEATIQLTTNTEEGLIEIPVYLNILGDVIERSMEFEAGWNLVSLDILLDEDDASLDSIFAGEIDAGNLVLVKNGAGDFFDPDLGINNIGDWNIEEGYKVNVVEATTVSVWGAEINDRTPIEVYLGWNMSAYYPDDPLAADYALESIVDELIIAKAGDGTFYLPEYGYNGIGDMEPGAGYQLKMDDDATLIYPEGWDGDELNDAPGRMAFTPEQVEPEHFLLKTYRTSTNMSILLTGSDVDGEKLKAGDEIAFYNPRGNCAGVAVWNDNDLVGVAVWGDDPLTEKIEGFVKGEALFARLWLAGDEIEIPVILVSPDEETKYSPEGLLIASLTGTRESVIPREFFLAQNYPNPFNPTTTIKYGLRTSVNVRLDVFNILGQRVRSLVNRPQRAGYYTVVWNGHDLTGQPVSSGTYFYRVHAGDFVKVRKMVIIK